MSTTLAVPGGDTRVALGRKLAVNDPHDADLVPCCSLCPYHPSRLFAARFEADLLYQFVVVAYCTVSLLYSTRRTSVVVL